MSEYYKEISKCTLPGNDCNDCNCEVCVHVGDCEPPFTCSEDVLGNANYMGNRFCDPKCPGHNEMPCESFTLNEQMGECCPSCHGGSDNAHYCTVCSGLGYVQKDPAAAGGEK